MRWIEVAVPAGSDKIDETCDELLALGAESFVIEDETDFKNFLENNHQYWDYVDEELEQRFAGVSRVKFYAADDEEGKALVERVRARFPELTTAFIEDSDWENNWREYYKPLPIGEKLIIVPEWEESDDPDRVPLRLDPGLIFGTGSHATTRMCLCALEKLSAPGKKVLDLGCGSGILGIGALVLGCERVVGCDIDPKAPDVACANAALNGLGADRFQVYAGDVLSDLRMRRRFGADYDIVLANIVADVIIPLSAIVGEFLAPDGVFVCSGVIEGRQEDVMQALERNGLRIVEHHSEEEWHAFTCLRA